MAGCHHRFNGHEFEQAPGDCEGQGCLACCSPWGHRVGHDQAMELMDSAMLLTYSFIPGMNSFDVLKKTSCLKMEGSVQALQLQGIFTPFNLDLKTTLKR